MVLKELVLETMIHEKNTLISLKNDGFNWNGSKYVLNRSTGENGSVLQILYIIKS